MVNFEVLLREKKEFISLSIKNSKVADVFSLNNDELVIEMTNQKTSKYKLCSGGNIRKYKGD